MIKQTLNQQFMQIPLQFLEPSEALSLKADLVQKFHMGTDNLFARQSFLDRARQIFNKREVQALKALYFMQFISGESFDWKALDQEVSTYKPIFTRHLGKDWMFFLNALLKLAREASQEAVEVKVETKKSERPRGLLHSVN